MSSRSESDKEGFQRQQGRACWLGLSFLLFGAGPEKEQKKVLCRRLAMPILICMFYVQGPLRVNLQRIIIGLSGPDLKVVCAFGYSFMIREELIGPWRK
jgi:hypothetical protein